MVGLAKSALTCKVLNASASAPTLDALPKPANDGAATLDRNASAPPGYSSQSASRPWPQELATALAENACSVIDSSSFSAETGGMNDGRAETGRPPRSDIRAPATTTGKGGDLIWIRPQPNTFNNHLKTGNVMHARPLPSQQILLNAEIIFAELHFHVHGTACESDIWLAALAAWELGSETLTMVEVAIAAAKAIETGVVRRPRLN